MGRLQHVCFFSFLIMVYYLILKLEPFPPLLLLLILSLCSAYALLFSPQLTSPLDVINVMDSSCEIRHNFFTQAYHQHSGCVHKM